MKRVLSLLLTLLMISVVLASCGQSQQPTPTADSSSSLETTPTPTPTQGADETTSQTTDQTPTPATQPATETTVEETGDHYVDDDDRSDIPEVKTHKMLDYLPSTYSLVGTKHLPPIDDQGGIGSCASEGITYMQFTNAVSRYIESKGIDPKWNPASGNEAYIFAPKFTYNFAGSGTAWVYDVLKDHGCMLLKDWHFFSTASGYKQGTDKNNRNPKSLDWPVAQGQLEDALNYRITDYEQIWTKSFKDQLTDSQAGQDMIVKIKDAICQGNVVVTGGFSSNWKYASVTKEDAEAGTGKIGEEACVWCNGTGGGHQVSIVGYDDDFVCSLDGVQLKGAFLVANSWGTWWKNDGYFWVMYDSINRVSEHPELNDSEKYEGRVNSMDQFCFIYWDKDIEIGMPDAYVTVEMSITDREGFYLELTRTDSSDVSTPILPSVFNYGMNFKNVRGSRDTLKDDDKYVNFSGKIDRPAETGVLTFGFQGLMGQNASFDDYLWGVNIYSTKAPLTIKKITLYDRTGSVRAEITVPEGVGTLEKGETRAFVFDEGKAPKSNHNIGSYILKSVAADTFVGKKGLLLIPAKDEEEAVQFDVSFDFFERYHVIRYENYALDIRGNVLEDGKQIQFNKESKTREAQAWKVVRLDDGTYNVRLAVNTKYALGIKDGQIVLVSGKDVYDYGRWYFEKTTNDTMSLAVRYGDHPSLTVEGKLPSRVKADRITIEVYNEAGESVKTVEVEVHDKTVCAEIDGLSKGGYLFVFKDAKGQYVSACYRAEAR